MKLFFVGFQSVNRLTKVGKTLFVFRHNVALKAAVVKIKRDILYSETVAGKFLYRILEEMHIIRFLVDFPVGGQKTVKYSEESFVGEPVVCVFLLRKRAGKVEIYQIGDSVGQVLRQIFRRTLDEAEIRDFFLNRFFGGDNNNIGAFLDGDEIDIGAALCNLGGKLSLAAADLKANGI